MTNGSPPYLPKIYKDFSGGQVSSMNPQSLADNELIKAYDVEIDERGCLKTRPRWQWFNETQVSIDAPMHGIHSFIDRDGREWLFIVGLNSAVSGIILRGTIASEMDFASTGGGTINWLVAPSSLSSDDHFNYPYPRSFTNYHSDLILAHARYTGVILIRFHHGWVSGGTFTGGTGQVGYQVLYWPIQSYVVTTFQNRLILANTARGQNFIHWSAPESSVLDYYMVPGVRPGEKYVADLDIFNPNAADGASEGSGWKNIYPNDGDGIVAASEWNGILGIFRRRSLLIMDSNFNVYKVHQGYGTASCYSVTLTSFGWVFIDYDGKGVFLWNGTSEPPTKISEQIDDEWKEMDVTPPMKIGSKIWDSELALLETGDEDTLGSDPMGGGGWDAGITETGGNPDLIWDNEARSLRFAEAGDAGGVKNDGAWISNVMTSEEAYVSWANIRPEAILTYNAATVSYFRVYFRIGDTLANCLAADWDIIADLSSAQQADVDCLWFAAFPTLMYTAPPSSLALGESPDALFIQIAIRFVRAAGGNSPTLSAVKLNYVHGDDPTTDFGKWPNLHWDGKKLWVNVWDGSSSHKYTFRTFVWDPKLNIWTRWKNANPACMTQFDKRTVWGTSHALIANHALRFTDQNEYSPTITADPVINPHIEIPYWDGGDPCRMEQLELIRISWKDKGTGTLIVRITVQRPPKGLTFDSDGNPLSNDPSPPPLQFAVPITLTGSNEDRVWNIGTRELMLELDPALRGQYEKSSSGSSARQFSQGYSFKVELMGGWLGTTLSDWDDVYWSGHNTEFILNSIELRATLLGDNKQIDVPQEV